MTDITISPEALEAAADELKTYFDTTHSQSFLREVARAACLAMLKAWPGMSDIPAGEFDGEQYPRIIHLPLPKEKLE